MQKTFAQNHLRAELKQITKAMIYASMTTITSCLVRRQISKEEEPYPVISININLTSFSSFILERFVPSCSAFSPDGMVHFTPAQVPFTSIR